MEDYVETLLPTDIDETGFTAHGRQKGWGACCFDWASSSELLPGIENEVETQAHHIQPDDEYWTEDGVCHFSARINSGSGTFFYRALVYSDGG
jgi:hypothetical protein